MFGLYNGIKSNILSEERSVTYSWKEEKMMKELKDFKRKKK